MIFIDWNNRWWTSNVKAFLLIESIAPTFLYVVVVLLLLLPLLLICPNHLRRTNGKWVQCLMTYISPRESFIEIERFDFVGIFWIRLIVVFHLILSNVYTTVAERRMGGVCLCVCIYERWDFIDWLDRCNNRAICFYIYRVMSEQANVMIPAWRHRMMSWISKW